MNTSRLAALALAVLPTLAGCSAGGAEWSDGKLEQPIYGGEPDSEHDAVVFIARVDPTGLIRDTVGACSGTIIALHGGSAVVLTAAHCASAITPDGRAISPAQVIDPRMLVVLPGPDWLSSYDTRTMFRVTQIALHPSYSGTVDSPADLALLRIVGTAEDTPSIPVLSSEDDDLALGSELHVVGYGATETSLQNTSRRRVSKQLSGVSSLQLSYQQADLTGSCEGDSGGPALYLSQRGERVAGVTSYGDAACAESGVSVRVSTHEDFLGELVIAMSRELDCEECGLATGTPGNACAEQAVECELGNTACGLLLACLVACADASCEASCAKSNPEGVADKNALDSCRAQACAATCADGTDQDAQDPTAEAAIAPAAHGDQVRCSMGAPLSSGSGALEAYLALLGWKWRRRQQARAFRKRIAIVAT